jgi:hypothetical protein
MSYNNDIQAILNDKILDEKTIDIIEKKENVKKEEENINIHKKKIMQNIGKKFYNMCKSLHIKNVENKEYKIMIKEGFFALLLMGHQKYGCYYNCECNGLVVFYEKEVDSCYVDLEYLNVVKNWYYRLKENQINELSNYVDTQQYGNEKNKAFDKLITESVENW